MSKVKVQKVPKDRLGEWPADPYVHMRDNPDHPADLSTVGWVFEFEGNFHHDNARKDLKGQTLFCRWLMASWTCHEGSAVKEAFLKRCHKEGVTFVYLYKCKPPMSMRQLRMCEDINARHKAESGQLETEAAA